MGTSSAENYDYALVGAGLQGGLVALALTALRPAARVLLVERGERLGGNHTWCFHSGDLDPDGSRIVAPLIAHAWSGYDVAFPRRQRFVPAAYAAVTSERLDEVVRAALDRPGCRVRVGCSVTRVGENELDLDDGTSVRAAVVVDARGPGRLATGAHVAFQKFLGLELELEHPHGLERPVLMDARVPQTDGFRFFYVLPLDQRRLLVEDTYFADGPELDLPDLRRSVIEYALARGFVPTRVVREEVGCLPLPTRELPAPSTASPLVAGYQGGWFHPTTGYSFPAAVRLALHVASNEPGQLFGGAWQRLTSEQRRQQRFFLFLNRLLFGAFAPEDRWNVLERFYGLPEPTIRRFYAMSTTAGDRARILCGRPPRGLSVRVALARGANA